MIGKLFKLSATIFSVMGGFGVSVGIWGYYKSKIFMDSEIMKEVAKGTVAHALSWILICISVGALVAATFCWFEIWKEYKRQR